MKNWMEILYKFEKYYLRTEYLSIKTPAITETILVYKM